MAVDLFVQIGQLFRNQTPEGDLSVWTLHRFLASDSAFAPFAKELAPIWDDKMVVEIWRTALPRMANAPYLKYPAPKKPVAPDALVAKVAATEAYTVAEAEEVVELLQAMGQMAPVLAYYGEEEYIGKLTRAVTASKPRAKKEKK